MSALYDRELEAITDLFHLCGGQTKKFGKAANGAQRFRCKTCGQTFIPQSLPRKKAVHKPDRLRWRRIKAIRQLLEDGYSVREIQRQTGHHQETIIKQRRQLSLKDCCCGRQMGHKGWCDARLKKHPVRLAYNQIMKDGGNEALTRIRPIQVAVEAIIPSGLSVDVREEMAANMILDLLGDVKTFAEVKRDVRRYVTQAWPQDYGTLSLDAPINEEGKTLGELIEG